MYRHIDAVGATNYEGWYDDAFAAPAVVQGASTAWLARVHATFPGKVLIVSEFGAEANRLNAPGTPGSESFQSSLLTRHIRSLRGGPVARRRARLEPAGLRARAVVRGRLHPPPGAEHQPRARDQPEGAVHLRGAAQAGGRCGAPGLRGLSLPSSVVRRRSSALRPGSARRLLLHRGKEGGGGRALARSARVAGSRRGVPAHFERVLQHLPRAAEGVCAFDRDYLGRCRPPPRASPKTVAKHARLPPQGAP